MTKRLPHSANCQDSFTAAPPEVSGDADQPEPEAVPTVAELQHEVESLRQALQDRDAQIQRLQTEHDELETRFRENTAALKESHDTLIAEVVERRQAEEALRTARDQLQAILDAVPGIVSWISSDLRYLGVNRHLAETFNLPRESFVGQPIGFLRTSGGFDEFVADFFEGDRSDAYREVSAFVAGFQRQFLIVAQKYNQGKAAFTVGIDITQRKVAEEALRQAEAKYRNIFENIVEGIFQTTPDGRYISANPALARIYGYISPEEMITSLTSIQQQLYVNSQRRREFIQALQVHGEVQGFESQVYRRDHTIIWISENARAVRDEDGSLLYYEGTVEDISDRKAAEAALQRANEELEQRVAQRTAALTEANHRLLEEVRERQRIESALRASEAELRALFAAMTDVITVFSSEGRYLEMVATNSELLFSPRTERVGKTVYEVLPPYQATLFMRYIHQALNTRQPVRFEYSLPIGELADLGQASGEGAPDDFENYAWYTAVVSPLPDNRVIWVARDITEKRRADFALQRAEEKYRSIFENVADGIFQITPEGYILSANPALARMLGYASPTDLMAQVTNIHDLYVDAQQRQEILTALHTPQGFVTAWEAQVYRADGEIIWISENIRAVWDNNGQLLYYEGTIDDITQRQQAEAALRESQRALSTLLGNLAGMAYRRACDETRKLEFVSEGCLQLTGYQPQHLLQDHEASFGRLVHPEDHRTIGEQLESSLAQKRPFELTYRIVTADQREKWVLEKGTGVYGESGEPIAIEGFVTDITDRIRVEEALKSEQEKSERLLLNILPGTIAAQLKQKPESVAYRFDEVTILFADIVNFTGLSASIPPTDLVNLLNRIFSAFDQLAENYGLEKIKTIGDAYMVVGGVPTPMENHTEAIANMALSMQEAIHQFEREDAAPFSLRIGIDTGPVVAGVIGIKKFSYDLWGDAVNVASRMESQGIGDRIQVTEAVYRRLQSRYRFESRGVIDIKGRGPMPTYWLLGRQEDT
jgi:PAS domain S-box-containing protein